MRWTKKQLRQQDRKKVRQKDNNTKGHKFSVHAIFYVFSNYGFSCSLSLVFHDGCVLCCVSVLYDCVFRIIVFCFFSISSIVRFVFYLYCVSRQSVCVHHLSRHHWTWPHLWQLWMSSEICLLLNQHSQPPLSHYARICKKPSCLFWQSVKLHQREEIAAKSGHLEGASMSTMYSVHCLVFRQNVGLFYQYKFIANNTYAHKRPECWICLQNQAKSEFWPIKRFQSMTLDCEDVLVQLLPSCQLLQSYHQLLNIIFKMSNNNNNFGVFCVRHSHLNKVSKATVIE